MPHRNSILEPILLKLNGDKDELKFNIQPKKKTLNFLAERMKILKFDRLNFSGSMKKKHSSRWQLIAELNFLVVQECVVTLESVKSFQFSPVTS